MLEKENNQLKELLSESDDIKFQLQKRVDSIPDLQIRVRTLNYLFSYSHAYLHS